MTTIVRRRDPADEGVVARMSAGGYGAYHRLECEEAPRRGDAGVRDLIHGPWRYLSTHWQPCARCGPPRDSSSQMAA